MWKNRKRRVVVASQAAPRKRARVAEPEKPKVAPEERMRQLEDQIATTETEIKEQAAQFQSARLAMLTGIVSHEGITAKELTESLMTKLAESKRKYGEALHERDTVILSQALQSKNIDGALTEGDGKCCEGGCKPEDMVTMTAKDMAVDVCTKCKCTFAHSIQPFNFQPQDLEVVRVGGYRPPNHFAEIVAQFQGKRRATAPQAVVDKIGDMCRRYHIEKHQITPSICRRFLKQLQYEQSQWRKVDKKSVPDNAKRFTDYYKNTPEIAYRLSGIPPPFLTPMQENRVIAMFSLVVRGYKTTPRYLARKMDRKNRKTRDEPNNMNYMYVFYKILQLLGYEEFLPYIPLPKSYSNIDDNDENSWKHICALYGWAYTPSR